MKKFYLLAWVALAAAIFFSLVAGTFSPASAVAYSLVALGLFYAFALWSVIVNTGDGLTEGSIARRGT